MPGRKNDRVPLSSPRVRGGSILQRSTRAKDDVMNANQISKWWTSSSVAAMVLLAAATAHGQSGTRNNYSAPSPTFSPPPSSQSLGSSSRFTAPPATAQSSQSISPRPFQSFATPAQAFSASSQFGGGCSTMTARPVLGVPVVTQFAPPTTVQTFRPVQVNTFGSPAIRFVQPAPSFPGAPVQAFRPVAPTPVRVYRPFGFRPAYVVPTYGGF